MQTLKRGIIVQIVMFIFFFLFGIDYILRELIVRGTLFIVIEFVCLGLLVALGVTWYLLTKKDAIIIADKQLVNYTKISLFIVAGGLILSVLSYAFGSVKQYVLISSGIIVGLAALFGLYASLKMLGANRSSK